MTRHSDEILAALNDYKEQLKTGGRIDHRVVSKAYDHIEWLSSLLETIHRMNSIWLHGCSKVEMANEHYGPKTFEEAKKVCEETRHEVNRWAETNGERLNQMKGAP